MPIGVIINSTSIILGGIIGALMGNKLPEKYKINLTLVFAVCSLGMGVKAIGVMENMPAVIMALVFGTFFGLAINLGKLITNGAILMEGVISKFIKNTSTDLPREQFLGILVSIIVLFCSSGTGIYGSIDSGMTGNHSILISKSILDFFTAMIFACNLGFVVSVITIPQFIIFTFLFIIAEFIFPFTTPTMINDFKACGGFLMIAAGLRIANIKDFPLADAIPSLILVMPFSYIWVNYILPFVS